MRVHIIVPARDNESVIGPFLKALPQAEKLMVVVHGSIDNTDAMAKIAGAHVMYSRAQDPGSACEKALRYSNYYEPDVVLFMTPEQDPGVAKRLISAIEEVDIAIPRDGVHPDAFDSISGPLLGAWLGIRHGAFAGSCPPCFALRMRDVHPLHVPSGNHWHRKVIVDAVKKGLKVRLV